MRDELVRMLGRDTVGIEDLRRKIGKVVRDDDTRLTTNRRGEYVPVMRIGQLQLIDQTLVAGDQTIGDRCVHECPRAS